MTLQKIIAALGCILLLYQGMAQKIQARVNAYRVVNAPLYSNTNIDMTFDGKRQAQGAMRLYRLDPSGITLYFKGEFKNDVLVNTAFIYDYQGVLQEQIALGDWSGGTSNFIMIGSRDFLMKEAGTRNGWTSKWEHTQGSKPHMTERQFYRSHKKEGTGEGFYPGGNLKAKYIYHNDTLDGMYTTFHPNGTKASEGLYVNGKMTGAWKWYSEDSEMTLYHSCYDCLRDSLTEFFSWGKIEKQLSEGKLHGDWREYDSIGRLEIYKHFSRNLQDSVEIVYYPNGKMASRGEFADNEPEGIFESWHPNGTIASKGRFHHGKQNGEWFFYDAKGKRTRIFYKSTETVSVLQEPDAPTAIMHEAFFSFRLIQFPENTLLRAPYTVKQEDKLRFMRKYKEIVLKGHLDQNGTIVYEIVTILKPKEYAGLSAFLAKQQIERAHPLKIHGKAVPVVMDIIIKWVD